VTAPHEQDRAAVTIRRGNFFLPGRVDASGDVAVQTDSAHVEWEAPATPTGRLPVIFVHGGGGQATDWKDTPDGRPGWVDRFVAAGHPVYNLDRVGHGRSSRAVSGDPGTLPPMDYGFAGWLWAPDEQAGSQTRWPGGRGPGDPMMDQLVAAAGLVRTDAVGQQIADAARLADLLDLVGESILVTHSAGAPSGWLAAAARPSLVRAIVAVEPIGPAFAQMPVGGSLSWGLTTAPIAYDPPVADASALQDGTPRTIPGLRDVPIAVVTGSSSLIGRAGPAITDFLTGVGARAEHVDLGSRGITGNGHGLMFESNSDETAGAVLGWIASSL